MKIGLISFSGRKGNGNCSAIAQYIENTLRFAANETFLLHIKDLHIQPCLGCSYECYKTHNCPIDDDVSMVYKFVARNDLVIFIVPVYSAAPPATYFAWRERSQGVFISDEAYQIYKQVKKLYVVIGNADAGGNDAINIIRSGDDTPEIDFVFLESHKYGLNSIEGRLIDVPEVRQLISERIAKLIEAGEK